MGAAKALAPIEVVVIGLSTGGPSALEHLLPRLPGDFPVPVLIVQHMPKLFTGALAERLDRCCALRVQEAYDDAVVRPGTVWLAPGDAHMEVASRRVMTSDAVLEGGGMRVRLHQREPLNHCKPAVDYLFLSAARVCGAGTLALVMTGMGADGLKGSRAVHAGRRDGAGAGRSNVSGVGDAGKSERGGDCERDAAAVGNCECAEAAGERGARGTGVRTVAEGICAGDEPWPALIRIMRICGGS